MDKRDTMKEYINAVRRKLNLPRDVKKRVMNDFISSIQCRQEAGQTLTEIIAELGTPAEAAAELNAQMKEYAYVKSPWRWFCCAVMVLSLLNVLSKGWLPLAGLILSAAVSDRSVGIIGGADGPTEIFVTSTANPWGILLPAMIFLMSLLGFWYLGHMRKKAPNDE